MATQDIGNGQREPVRPRPRRLALSAKRALEVGLILILAASVFIAGWVTRATLSRGAHGSRSGPPPAQPVVAVYGDSLVGQAMPYLKLVGSALGLTVSVNATGGGAPCDELAALRRDVAAEHIDAVVWAFSGNNSSPCMRSPQNAPLAGPAKLAKYRVDTQAAIDATTHAQGLFVLASPPAHETGDMDWKLLDSLYRGLVYKNPSVQYADASTAIAPDGHFAPTQTCLPFERSIPQARADCTSPAAVIPVRGQDGTHFCPVPYGAPCNSYASGAMRYAINLLSAARLDYDFARTVSHPPAPPATPNSTRRTNATA